MSTGFYIKGKDNIGNGNIDLSSDDIIALLIDTNQYSVDFTSDETQSDIPEEAIIAEKSLIAPHLLDNIFDADDLIFSEINEGENIGAIILAKNTGAVTTSLLICYIDNDPNFPIESDGTDITIEWPNTENKIFKL